MADKTAVAPIEKKRVQALKAMSPALQEVAIDFESKLGRGAQGIIMIQYNMGSRIADVLGNESKYGTGAVKQLAEYLNIPGGESTLYNLRNFANEFDKDYVQQWSCKPMANGRFLELSHWYQLMKLKDRKDQEKTLTRVLKESLSANDLEKEIRARSADQKNTRQGGRKPKAPSSAIAGLQVTFNIANKLNNYEPVAEEKVFDVVDGMDADDVTETLKNSLEKATEALSTAKEKVESLHSRAEDCLERVVQILEERAEEAEDQEDEEEKPKKKAKKAKKAKDDTKADSNGAEPKKKRGRPKKAAVAAVDEDEEDEDE